MEIGWVYRTPVLKRIPEQRDTVDRITTYGSDNLYPQRMREIYLLSPTTKSAVNLMASFIRGDGFENGDTVVNRFGETANDILELVANDKALYNGYAILVNSNALGFAVEIQHIPFEFVRLGLIDQSGRAATVAVSNNWEGSNRDKLPEDIERITRYRLYRGNEAAAEATRGRGMVMYVTPERYCYPISTIDAIIETSQSDNELQLFELGNLTNGFLSMSVFKMPVDSDLESEQDKIREKLKELQGAKNANSVLVAAVPEDWNGGDLVEPIPANNNDTLFTQTTLNVKNRICHNFALPPALLGMLPEGSVFTQDQIADNYTYMNLQTKDTRNHIERNFQKLGLNFGRIIPNQFESSQMLDNNGPTERQPMDSEV